MISVGKEDYEPEIQRLHSRITDIFRSITALGDKIEPFLKMEEKLSNHADTLSGIKGDIKEMQKEVKDLQLEQREARGRIKGKKGYETIFWRIVTPLIVIAFGGYLGLR